MTTVPMRVKSLNVERYAETFAEFVRRSLEYDQILSAIQGCVDRLPRDYAMLDVGAGTGEIIHALVKIARLRPYRYVAFEPNPVHFEALTSATDNLGLPEVELRQAPFDESVPLESCFDFVLFSHSLYWMKDPAKVFEHAVHRLKSGGTAMGILQGPYGVHTLLALYEPRFERLTPMLQNNTFSSHEFLAGLRGRGLKARCHMMPTPLDMTGLFDPAQEKALFELMSFCLQLEFQALDPALRAEIIEHVKGATVPVGEKSLWFIPNAVVTVSAGT